MAEVAALAACMELQTVFTVLLLAGGLFIQM